MSPSADPAAADPIAGEAAGTARVLDLATLRTLVKQPLAVTDYLEVPQEMIARFGELTLDRQWIHMDPERARAHSPFRGTVAHGMLTLSLVPHFVQGAVKVSGVKLGVNMGFDHVRFPSAVPAGSRVRARIELAAVGDGPGWAQCTWFVTLERQGGRLPACVAEWLVRYYLG